MAPTLRILLVEDNPGDVFLVKEALHLHCTEFDLTVATDGKRAWELIEQAEIHEPETFTFFLLDLNLPVRPGLELLMRIRSSAAAISWAPVVMVTSSNAARDRRSTMQAGADHYFCKPSDLEEFLELGAIVRDLWTARAKKLQDRPPNTFDGKGDL